MPPLHISITIIDYLLILSCKIYDLHKRLCTSMHPFQAMESCRYYQTLHVNHVIVKMSLTNHKQ